jgi:TetR/AcrR family transcriptional regulator, transcriptional repressor for nem operon
MRAAGAMARWTAFHKEEQRGQGAGKMGTRAGSAAHPIGEGPGRKNLNGHAASWTSVRGQLPFLGYTRIAMASQVQHEAKTRLLDAALHVIRAKGYAATTVDDICHQAGVTKGSFFHHFKSKQELALAAANHFSEMAEGLFAAAPYHQPQDPLERLLGYVDFRAQILSGELHEYTCLLGMLVQETYATHPDIRAACDRGMSTHIAELTRDIEAARQRYAPDAQWTAASVGYFIQSVLQGAFIFAKAKQSPAVARESLAHLRRYLESLFVQPTNNRRKEKS